MHALWRPLKADPSSFRCPHACRLVPAALLAFTLASTVVRPSDGPVVAAQAGCQTPFLVYTDPANPGLASESGDVRVTRDSGLLGEFLGGGRFDGYTIQGAMDSIENTTTGMARVQGEFGATSPDGGSSITVWYTGQVDFGAATARGNFTVVGGTGSDAGYRASGAIEGNVVAPATLYGVDIGLC